MQNDQYSGKYVSSVQEPTTMNIQTVNPYAALVATAGPEHDGRSSSSASPPSSGSPASLVTYNEGARLPATSFRSQMQTHSRLEMPQQHIYSSPEHSRTLGASTNSMHTRTTHFVPAAALGTRRTAGDSSSSSAFYSTNFNLDHHLPHITSQNGITDSISVQETAFRQGKSDGNTTFGDLPSNPFGKQFDQLWEAFYKRGQECSHHHNPTPVDLTQQNFTWPVLINPYTQSPEKPRGSFDPAWSRKVIQVALRCMEELIRVICRRKAGWDKIVADIPSPAQEALVAFPDLAQLYEQLKRDAQEARAGGRPRAIDLPLDLLSHRGDRESYSCVEAASKGLPTDIQPVCGTQLSLTHTGQ